MTVIPLTPSVPAMPKSKRTFQVEIEATLHVDAFDESSARTKIDRVLKSHRAIGPDVRTAGEGCSYDATMLSD